MAVAKINELSRVLGILSTKFDHASDEIRRQGNKIDKTDETYKEDRERRDVLRESLRAGMIEGDAQRDNKIWELRNSLTAQEERLTALVSANKKRLDSIEQSILDLTNADRELFKMTWKQIGIVAGASAAVGAITAFLMLISKLFVG